MVVDCYYLDYILYLDFISFSTTAFFFNLSQEPILDSTLPLAVSLTFFHSQ